MIHETVSLGKGEKVTLTTYIHDQSEQARFQIEKRPAIIIMPGGAYSYLADAEGEPVALTFLKEGYNTFALRYSVGDDCTYPEILEEVSLAIWKVRSHAEAWHVDPDAVILMGVLSRCVPGGHVGDPVEHTWAGRAARAVCGRYQAKRRRDRLCPLGQHQCDSERSGIL